MATVRIDTVGGIYPAQQPRNLPASGAQTANNLMARMSSFRPLLVDLGVATAATASPNTLYRLARTSAGAFNTDMTTGWVTNPAVVNYVKGQLDDDATERTYYTYGDGSAPPRVLNALGADRTLGVPNPGAAPGVVLTVGADFTPEDREAAIRGSTQSIINTIHANLVVSWIGIDAVTPTQTLGYANYQTAYEQPTTQDQQIRLYRTSSINSANNGAIVNTYSGYGVEAYAPWVWDPIVGAYWGKPTNTTLYWTGYSAGYAPDHVVIPFYAYGRGYTVGAGMAAALATLVRPGTATTPLLTTAQITGAGGLIEYVTNWTSQADPLATPKIKALSDKVLQVKALLDGGTIGGNNAERAAFYVKTNVATELDNEVTNIAKRLYDRADAAFRSATPPEYLYNPGDGA